MIDKIESAHAASSQAESLSKLSAEYSNLINEEKKVGMMGSGRENPRGKIGLY